MNASLFEVLGGFFLLLIALEFFYNYHKYKKANK